ncbi:hypothetical protein NKG94_22065 [Micromonospora sp. M12]
MGSRAELVVEYATSVLLPSEAAALADSLDATLGELLDSLDERLEMVRTISPAQRAACRHPERAAVRLVRRRLADGGRGRTGPARRRGPARPGPGPAAELRGSGVRCGTSGGCPGGGRCPPRRQRPDRPRAIGPGTGVGSGRAALRRHVRGLRRRDSRRSPPADVRRRESQRDRRRSGNGGPARPAVSVPVRHGDRAGSARRRRCGRPGAAAATGGPGSGGLHHVHLRFHRNPKAVRVPHRAVVRLVREPDHVRCAPGERMLRFAPLAFDASTLELFAPSPTARPWRCFRTRCRRPASWRSSSGSAASPSSGSPPGCSG